MGIANPWLLLGLAALAVPVLVHLVLREEESGRAFPSLMFLRRIPFELKRRRRLRDRLLFAMRCLALAALVIAFAGPYTDAETALSSAPGSRDVVWLLDRSYSMNHPERWERAAGEIRGRIEALGSGERGALVAFDDRPRIIAELTSDRAALRSALAGVEPGQTGTGLAAAFAAADSMLSGSPAVRRQVVLVSDLQRSAVEAGGPLPLGNAVELQIVPIAESIGANATVVDARLAPRSRDAVEDTLTVRVGNTGDAPLEEGKLEVIVDGHAVETRALALEPGEDRVLNLPIVLAVEHPTRIVIRVGPDALPADDLYHAVLAPRRPLAAALIEPETSRAHHGVFLEEALQLARAPAFEVRRVAAEALDENVLAAIDVVILDDTTLPSPSAVRAVEAFLERGGGVLYAAGPSTVAGGATPDREFLGRMLGSVESRDDAGGHLGAHIELTASDHPLWSTAGVDGERVLSGARIATARNLNPGPDDRVLARLSDGVPLLVEHPAGAGRILVLATTADPRWSTLALEPGFVPFVHAALVYLSGGARWQPAYPAGAVVDLVDHAASLPGTADWRSYLANGGTVVLEHPGGDTQRLRGSSNTLATADTPGIYEAHRSDGRGPGLPFAVNVGRAESMLAATTPGELERSIARRDRNLAGTGTEQFTHEPGTFDLPWWLITLAGLALAGEGLLAGWLSRRRSATAGAG